MTDFDYEWGPTTDPERVRKVVAKLGSHVIRIQWKSGGGATIERSLSDVGLERWRVRAFQVRDLEEIEKFLRELLGPLANHAIKMHPIYQDTGFSFIGWIFFHRKEE